jgi:hypothetical protein
MNTRLNELWLSQEVPDVSAIYLRSGAVYPIEMSRRSNTVLVNKLSSTTLDDILARTNLGFSSIDAYFQQDFIVESTKFDVQCGDGSLGGDGFICVNDHNGVFWIAFFVDSNPFMTADVVDKNIFAKNNLGEIWQFPIYSPQDFRVVQFE